MYPVESFTLDSKLLHNRRLWWLWQIWWWRWVRWERIVHLLTKHLHDCRYVWESWPAAKPLKHKSVLPILTTLTLFNKSHLEQVLQMKVMKVRWKADQGLPKSLALSQVHLGRLFGRSGSPIILVQLPSWCRRPLFTISMSCWGSELALDTNQ